LLASIAAELNLPCYKRGLYDHPVHSMHSQGSNIIYRVSFECIYI